MIFSDIRHKYHKWCFEIALRNFTRVSAREIWDNFEMSHVVFIPNITVYYYPQKVCYFHMQVF